MAIPNQTITMNHVGNIQEDIPMGIRSEDFRYLADVLNGLYSDTIAAPVREYSTNAWDSHVEAGVTRPIEITLPTAERLEFVVQDFGLGMSPDDLRNTYSMYGASDKRNSNAVAGQLGLGSKSGLSYAEAFTVTAIKGGVKTVAMVTKDDHGIGVIKILDTLVVDEPNGVRITIPVDRYDVNNFRNAATNLFQFWSPGTVLIDGEAPATPEWAVSALRLDDDTLVVRSDAGLYSSYVIMGNVAYPVPDAKIGRTQRRFVARLNIGDVDFVPSREAVKHTRHTDATLADLTAYIGENFDRALTRSLATVSSRWEETLIKILWKDQSLSFRTESDRPIWTYTPNVNYGRKSQSHLAYRVDGVSHSAVVVITDFPAKNVSTAARERLVEFIGNSKTQFVILPKGLKGVGVLEGRPGTFTWDTVTGATAKPKADRAQRGPKVETLYAVVNAPAMTAPQLAALSGKVLFLNPGEHARHGSLGATVVSLYSANQLPRIKRFVPGVVYYYDEVATQKAAAHKALTALDVRIAQARTLPSAFQALDHTKVDDPELAEVIRLSKADDTDTMAKAKALGVGVQYPPLSEFFAKYPLLNNGYYHSSNDKALVTERLFYVNARYAANVAAQAQAVAS